MNRPLLRLTAAVVMGALTTIAISWAFAVFATTAGRPTRQGLLLKTQYHATFGRSDAWGITQVYWRATEEGGRRWGEPDALVGLPSWSRAQRLRAPFPTFDEFRRRPGMLSMLERRTQCPGPCISV